MNRTASSVAVVTRFIEDLINVGDFTTFSSPCS
jgi:hypothetical protein